MNRTSQSILPADRATVAKFKKYLNFRIPADVEALVMPAILKHEKLWRVWSYTCENVMKIARDGEREAFKKAIAEGRQPAICRSEFDISAGQDATKTLFQEELSAIVEDVLPYARRVVLEFSEALTGAANNLEITEQSAAAQFDISFEPSMTLRTMRNLAAVLPGRLPEKAVGHGFPRDLFQGLL